MLSLPAKRNIIFLASLLIFFLLIIPRKVYAQSFPVLRPNSGNQYRLQLPPNDGFRYVFGDLDGDGRLDPVVKAVYGTDYRVEAYKNDGTRLWSQSTNLINRIGTGDMIHELNLVWDLDAEGGALQAPDGKWEVVYNYKRTDGTWGIRVVDGATGSIRADVPWPGPTYGNAGQHRGTIAYLDGQTPSIIVNDGGEYGPGRIYAFDKNLNKLWDYSPGASYGAHMVIAYDLDGDGKDEVIVGGTVLNGNGTKRWSLKDKGYGYMDLVQPGDHQPGNAMSEIYYLAVETPRGSFDGGSNPIVVDQNGNTVWENWSVYYCDHNARGWAGDVTGDGLAEFYTEDHTYDVCPDGSIPKASYDNWGNVFDRGIDKGRVYDSNGDGVYEFGRWDGAADLSGDGGEENFRWDNTGGWIEVEFGSGGPTPHRWGNRSYMVQYTSYASGYAPWMYTPRAAVVSGGGTTPTPTSGPTSTPFPTSTPTPKPLPTLGDLDKDGDVDIFDYNLLADNFGNTSCGNIADINGNCKVDIFDYNILIENFGKKTTLTPTSQPTPTSPQTSGVDLIPDDIWWSPDPVSTGKNVTIGFRVKNVGNQASGQFSVVLKKDGVQFCSFTVYGLNPNEIFERGPNIPGGKCEGLYGVQNAQPPGYTLQLLVDDLNQVGEINESNNTLTKFMPVN